MPADLRPKPKPKKICIPARLLFIIAFIIIFIIAVIIAFLGRGAYFYNFPLA